MSQVADYTDKIPFLNKLTDSERQLLLENTYLKTFPNNTYIYNGNGDTNFMGMLCIIKGSLRVHIVSPKGREVTLYRLSSGDYCAILPRWVLSQISFNTRIVTVGTSELLFTPPEVFYKITETNLYARCFLYELGAKRYRSVLWVLQQIIVSGTDGRIASYLLSEYHRTGKNIIRMTQEEVAEEVNTAREVVARMFKRFSTENILEVKRGEIHLKDITRLESIVKK